MVGSPASRTRRENGRPGSSLATGGPPAIVARGQAGSRGAADLGALATWDRPRHRGHGFESEEVARDRSRLDAVNSGAPLQGRGMRRSEVSAVR